MNYVIKAIIDTMRVIKFQSEFSGLLALLLLIHCVTLCCYAVEPKRARSLHSSRSEDSNLDSGSKAVKRARTFTDGISLISEEGKPNKVSAFMRYAHHKLGNMVYNQGSDNATETSAKVEDEYAGHSDDEVIKSVCTNFHGIEGSKLFDGRTCRLATLAALQAEPDKRAIIANAIKQRPSQTHPRHVLYIKMVELGIDWIERNDLDERADKSFNLMLARSPYGRVGAKALDLAVQANRNSFDFAL